MEEIKHHLVFFLGIMSGFREVRKCLSLKSEEVIHSHKYMLNEDENSVKKNEESSFGIFMEVY